LTETKQTRISSDKMDCNPNEFWRNLKHKDSLDYPYKPQSEIAPPSSDVFNRDRFRLVASLIKFGEIKLNDDHLETISNSERNTINAFLRICNDRMRNQDLDFFKAMAQGSKNSIVFPPKAHEEDRPVDWKVLQQAVFLNSMNQDTTSVYLVSLSTGMVDVYSVGECDIPELQTFAIELINFFGKKRPDLKLSFRYRLQVPSTLWPDPLLMVYVLALQLHRQTKYLNLDAKTIMHYKLQGVSKFQQSHDDWLGKFHLTRTMLDKYQFIVQGYENRDNVQNLHAMGWKVIDVSGDGNCGYYVWLLCLENVGIIIYQPLDDDDYKNKVMLLRRNMRTQSRKLVQKYKKNPMPKLWMYANLDKPKEVMKLNTSLFTENMTKIDMFIGELKQDFQMDATWGSHVFASMFGLRVIMYIKHVEEEGIIWTTHIWDSQGDFASDDHIIYENKDGIDRLTDAEFMEKPTVEILFLTGVADKHFLFLCRVFCDGIETSEELGDNRTLMAQLKERIKSTKISASSATDINESERPSEQLQPIGESDVSNLTGDQMVTQRTVGQGNESVAQRTTRQVNDSHLPSEHANDDTEHLADRATDIGDSERTLVVAHSLLEPDGASDVSNLIGDQQLVTQRTVGQENESQPFAIRTC
jgi:hypothetical protein